MKVKDIHREVYARGLCHLIKGFCHHFIYSQSFYTNLNIFNSFFYSYLFTKFETYSVKYYSNYYFHNVSGKGNKDEVDRILKHNLSGLSRAPAMTFGNLTVPLKDLNLENYEISPVEPLHDLKGHIKNVWEVLPLHLSPRVKELFLEKLRFALGRISNFNLFFIPILKYKKGRIVFPFKNVF